MRKIYTIFTLCLLTAIAAGAETVTLSWSGNGSNDSSTSLTTSNFFTNGYYTGDTDVATVSEIQYVYVAGSSNGLKLGKSGAGGVMTFAFSSGIKPNKITVNAKQYSNNETSLTVTVNGSSALTTSSLTSDFADYEIEMDGSTTLTEIKVTSGSKRAFVKSIIITYTTQQSSNAGKYVLVTSVNTLTAGDKVIIANSSTAGSADAISTSKDNSSGDYYRPGTEVTIENVNGSMVIDADDNVEIYNLGQNNGAWTFQATSTLYNGKYLACATNNYNNAYYISELADNARATITVNNNTGVTNIAFNAGSNNCLRYSTQYSKFECFASTVTNYVQNVYIYRLEESSEPELTVVTGIGGFKGVAEGSTVRLYLPDSYNARVLHVKSNSNGTSDAYVRDNNGGAMLMQGISPNRPMAYGQHLAGYINGTYSTNSDDMPLFVPEDGLTNTSFLVIADPVTESEVNPKEIDVSDLADNLADWVTVKDIETSGNAITFNNALESSYTAPYSGSIVDVSAIAASSNKVYPITHNDVPIITYVIDSEKDFVSPPGNISNTAVRVKRSLAAGQWAPLTLPFDYDEFDGIVQEYSSLANGDPVTGSESNNTFDAGTMYFNSVSAIQAGVPYMVKPNEDYEEFIARGVTLSKTGAATVTHTMRATVGNRGSSKALSDTDEYSFVGVYSPTTLDKNKTNKIMDANGNILWASDVDNPTVEGTSGYFVTPANQGLHLALDGESGVITGITDIVAGAVNVPPTGIYNIMGVKMPDDWEQLPPGFYIVNGVKTIKR